MTHATSQGNAISILERGPQLSIKVGDSYRSEIPVFYTAEGGSVVQTEQCINQPGTIRPRFGNSVVAFHTKNVSVLDASTIPTFFDDERASLAAFAHKQGYDAILKKEFSANQMEKMLTI